jgi:ubiquinone biosynthesis protein
LLALCCAFVQSTSIASVTGLWLSAARRLQRIGVVLARHGFGEIVDQMGVLVPRFSAAPSPSTRERLALRLVEVLTELGPTYVKLGQLLATRADLLPPDVVQALSRLHSEVRPLPFREIVRVLEGELGKPYAHAFAQLDTQCLAAASIGQVHRARLRDGREVVVKVQRPGLRQQVEADLTIMRLFAQLLTLQVPEVAAYQPLALLDAFTRAIRMELDFRIEAENAEKLRAVLRDASEVHLPRVYAEWTSERVLVMEYVVGARLSELPVPLRHRARKALLRAFVRQMLEHGVFHADPHPGNLLSLADGRVVLLDLGTVDVLDTAMRGGLFRLGIALLFNHSRSLCHALMRLAQADHPERVDRVRLARDLELLLDTASRGQGGALVGQMLSVSRVHALRLPPALLALMRALAILDGVLRELDPESDLVRDLRREVAWATARRLGHNLRAPWLRMWNGSARYLRRALDLIRRPGSRP